MRDWVHLTQIMLICATSNGGSKQQNLQLSESFPRTFFQERYLTLTITMKKIYQCFSWSRVIELQA